MEENDSKANKGFARQSARDILGRAKIKSIPILLREITKSIPDLFVDGQELQEEISGMQASYKGVFFIRYNVSHSVKRNRFTVAHEIGHLLLGHTSPCTRSNNSKEINEVEANQFAAELLMPLSFLKTEIKRYTTVDSLAKAFWVSRDAMSKRVLETGLYKSLATWS